MLVARSVIGMSSIVLLLPAATLVSAQDYPSKPIRLVASGIGGATDFVARLVAQGIAGPMGQQVFVDNRASGVVPGEVVAKSPPDGYTLLVAGATFWIGALVQKTPYDPVKDFSPITLTNKQPNVLVVHPSIPVKSVKEFIALAKARPKELNYASGNIGGTSYLAGALFNHMAGVNIVNIPYTSSSQQLADLLSGQVQVTFFTPVTAMPYVKSGKLRVLAVTSVEPSPLQPGVPTVSASGLPGFEAVALQGMFAPAKTPDAIIKRLNQEIVRFLNTPELKDKLLSSGYETVGSTPEEFANKIKSEMTTLGKLIKDAGIRVN